MLPWPEDITPITPPGLARAPTMRIAGALGADVGLLTFEPSPRSVAFAAVGAGLGQGFLEAEAAQQVVERAPDAEGVGDDDPLAGAQHQGGAARRLGRVGGG